jgi:hypothetical protein
VSRGHVSDGRSVIFAQGIEAELTLPPAGAWRVAPNFGKAAMLIIADSPTPKRRRRVGGAPIFQMKGFKHG